MANNRDTHEGYLEIPMEDYIVIGETAIHKKFTFWWGLTSLFIGAAGVAVAAYTNWYSVLANRIWNILILQYWFLTIPFLVAATVFFYYFLRTKHREHRAFKQKKVI